jgi:hypothetical protein
MPAQIIGVAHDFGTVYNSTREGDVSGDYGNIAIVIKGSAPRIITSITASYTPISDAVNFSNFIAGRVAVLHGTFNNNLWLDVHNPQPPTSCEMLWDSGLREPIAGPYHFSFEEKHGPQLARSGDLIILMTAPCLSVAPLIFDYHLTVLGYRLIAEPSVHPQAR